MLHIKSQWIEWIGLRWLIKKTKWVFTSFTMHFRLLEAKPVNVDSLIIKQFRDLTVTMNNMPHGRYGYLAIVCLFGLSVHSAALWIAFWIFLFDYVRMCSMFSGCSDSVDSLLERFLDHVVRIEFHMLPNVHRAVLLFSTFLLSFSLSSTHQK